MKKLITICAFLMLVSGIFAQTSFTVDGINYITTSANTVAVTSNLSKYTGSITIPPTVDYSTVTYNVTSIGINAFNGCSGLTTIVIPSSVTSIGDGAFYDCRGLTSIDVNANNSNYSSLDGVLFDKDQTKLIQYPSSKQGAYTIPSSVTSIGICAFSHCAGLTSITIPNSVTSIGIDAFYGCSGLTSVIMPNSVTSIGINAFNGCSGLTTIVIPSSVTSIGGGAFSHCSGLTSIDVNANNSNYSSLDGVFFDKDQTKLIQYPSSKQGAYTIPSSVTSIGVFAFQRCSGLTTIVIPSSVTSIGDGAFMGCSGLTSITIPSSVTSIRSVAFSGCSGLTSITIPSSVTSIGDGAFAYCAGLTSVIIPSSVTSIGDGTFYYCSGLTSVSIPSFVTSIGINAFNGCSGLTTIVIPSSVTSIGGGAFQGCSGLTSVTIPSSVTSIGSFAFYGCSGLTSVTIPSSVTSIGYFAFDGCSGLTSIYAYPITPVKLSLEYYVFNNVNKTTCTLYVPTGSKAAYQDSFQWQDFINIVEVTTAVQIVNDTNFSFYLNPMDNAISINGLKGTLRLFDMNGRLLLIKQVAGYESVSIGSLPQGLYFVKLITTEGTVERKVMKK